MMNKIVRHGLRCKKSIAHHHYYYYRRHSSSLVGSFSDVQEAPKQVLLKHGIGAMIATLNNPGHLNALTTNMVVRLRKLLEKWESDDDVHLVIVRGAGGAFSSGIDAKSLYKLGVEGNFSASREFFRELYHLNYIISTYGKFWAGFMDGIVRGAAYTLNMHGEFQLATERTAFSVPETQIGFHNDGGSSYMLSRLPGSVGEYLALTGEELDATEMRLIGLITDHFHSKYADEVEHQLRILNTDDPYVIEHVLEGYEEGYDLDPDSCLHRMEAIDRCFSKDTIEDIIASLEGEAEGHDYAWYRDAIDNIRAASPLSQKIALKSIRDARSETLEECLEREFRISCRIISGEVSKDFYEGVRSQIVDEDMKPKWAPNRLEDVTSDMVNIHFERLEDELELPIAERGGLSEARPQQIEEIPSTLRRGAQKQQVESSAFSGDILDWATGPSRS